MLRYKIYSFYFMKRYVTTVDSMNEMIDLIGELIYREDSYYIIIVEDTNTNSDIDVIGIRSIEEFEKFKTENYTKVKKLEK